MADAPHSDVVRADGSGNTQSIAGDLVPWPWRRRGDGPLPGYTEAPGRAEYSAYRLGTAVFITAKGVLPNWNQIPDIRQLPIRIFPPQFGMFFYTPAIVLPTLRPFVISEPFGYPKDEKTLTMHDLDGSHVIEIADAAVHLPSVALAETAKGGVPMTAMGHGSSLQDAYDNAVAQLPTRESGVADSFVTYKLLETGSFYGGFAGIRAYFAKVQATFSRIQK